MNNSNAFSVRPPDGRGLGIMCSIFFFLWCIGFSSYVGEFKSMQISPVGYIVSTICFMIPAMGLIYAGAWGLWGEERLVSSGDQFIIEYRILGIVYAPRLFLKKANIRKIYLEQKFTTARGHTYSKWIIAFACEDNEVRRTKVALTEESGLPLLRFLETELMKRNGLSQHE